MFQLLRPELGILGRQSRGPGASLSLLSGPSSPPRTLCPRPRAAIISGPLGAAPLAPRLYLRCLIASFKELKWGETSSFQGRWHRDKARRGRLLQQLLPPKRQISPRQPDGSCGKQNPEYSQIGDYFGHRIRRSFSLFSGLFDRCEIN